MCKVKRAKVEPYGMGYRLVEPYSYTHTKSYATISIKTGYVTRDGASVPRFLWWFQPPYDPRMLSAVIVHDYLCDLAKTYEDYKIADDVFEDMLLQLDTLPKWKIKIMVWAVRVYHKLKYGGLL